jgi:hypothetical protein
MSTARRYRIFLAALSIVGSFFVLLATSHYGPGVSTDGTRYMSTAESILQGRGIVDYLGLPLVNWPPLYPIILAAFSAVTGADVFVVGQVINILAFGVSIWLAGVFFERSLPGNYTFAVIASLVLATSVPLIEVSANIASDPLFFVCVLLFLLAAQDYAARRRPLAAWQLGAVTVAACFLRYAGLALVISGALVIFLAWRPDWLKAVLHAALWGLAAGAPIAAFAIFHNYRLTGAILGAHLPAYPWGLFLAFVSKVASWFVPERLLQIAPPLSLFAALLALLALRSSRTRWSGWLRRLQTAPVLSSAVFFAVYGLMLIFAISYPEHRVAGSQRIHALLLPSLLVLAAMTVQVFAPALPKNRAALWRNALLAVFALWMLFPLYRVAVYVRASMAEGDISYYNLYNTRTLRESDVVAYIQSSEFPGDERVYSNNEGAAYFYLRRHIYRLPRYDAELGENLGTVMLEFDGWPDDDENATLVWFKRDLDYKETVPTPEQMSAYVRLIQIWTGRYGIVYLMDVDLAQ